MTTFYQQQTPFVEVGETTKGQLYAVFPYCPPLIKIFKDQLMGRFGDINLGTDERGWPLRRRAWFLDMAHKQRVITLLAEHCPAKQDWIERVYAFEAPTPVRDAPTLDGIALLQHNGANGWQARRWGTDDLFDLIEAHTEELQPTYALAGACVLRIRHRVGAVLAWETTYAPNLTVPDEERRMPTITDITPPPPVTVREEPANAATETMLFLAAPAEVREEDSMPDDETQSDPKQSSAADANPPRGYGVVRLPSGKWLPVMLTFFETPDDETAVSRLMPIGMPMATYITARRKCERIAASPRPQDAAKRHRARVVGE